MATETHPAVLVIGEALMDITTTAAGTRETPGGGPANVALGLARRGVPTALLTSLGRDARGLAITAHLEESGVDVLPESFRSGSTSTAHATLDRAGAATYVFDIAWEILAELEIAPPPTIHTGSLAAFLAPGAAAVRSVLAAHPSAIVTFDPNIRASLIGDAAAARSSFEDFARGSTVVKLSDEDAAFLYPHLGDADVVAAILALGPRLVAVTRGGAGAVLATAHDVVEVAAPRVEVIDTIGAGDTFMASLIAEPAIRSGDPLSADDLIGIGRRAVAAAAITVSRTGADLPWADELD